MIQLSIVSYSRTRLYLNSLPSVVSFILCTGIHYTGYDGGRSDVNFHEHFQQFESDLN